MGDLGGGVDRRSIYYEYVQLSLYLGDIIQMYRDVNVNTVRHGYCSDQDVNTVG
jgi:hypothetical protein